MSDIVPEIIAVAVVFLLVSLIGIFAFTEPEIKPCEEYANTSARYLPARCIKYFSE